MKHKTAKKKSIISTTFRKTQFVYWVYPVLAGVPTAMLLLYFLDMGYIYRDILNNLISPIITGVVSGIVLYFFGIRK